MPEGEPERLPEDESSQPKRERHRLDMLEYMNRTLPPQTTTLNNTRQAELVQELRDGFLVVAQRADRLQTQLDRLQQDYQTLLVWKDKLSRLYKSLVVQGKEMLQENERLCEKNQMLQNQRSLRDAAKDDGAVNLGDTSGKATGKAHDSTSSHKKRKLDSTQPMTLEEPPQQPAYIIGESHKDMGSTTSAMSADGNGFVSRQGQQTLDTTSAKPAAPQEQPKTYECPHCDWTLEFSRGSIPPLVSDPSTWPPGPYRDTVQGHYQNEHTAKAGTNKKTRQESTKFVYSCRLCSWKCCWTPCKKRPVPPPLDAATGQITDQVPWHRIEQNSLRTRVRKHMNEHAQECPPDTWPVGFASAKYFKAAIAAAPTGLRPLLPKPTTPVPTGATAPSPAVTLLPRPQSPRIRSKTPPKPRLTKPTTPGATTPSPTATLRPRPQSPRILAKSPPIPLLPKPQATRRSTTSTLPATDIHVCRFCSRITLVDVNLNPPRDEGTSLVVDTIPWPARLAPLRRSLLEHMHSQHRNIPRERWPRALQGDGADVTGVSEASTSSTTLPQLRQGDPHDKAPNQEDGKLTMNDKSEPVYHNMCNGDDSDDAASSAATDNEPPARANVEEEDEEHDSDDDLDEVLVI